MGVVAVGECGQVNLQHVAGVHLGADAEEALVTAQDFLLFSLDVVRLDRCVVVSPDDFAVVGLGFHGLDTASFAEAGAEHFVFDALAPEVARLFLVCRPVGLGAVGDKRLVNREIKVCPEDVLEPAVGRLEPGEVAPVNLEGRRDVTALGQVVEQCTVLGLEFLVVGLQENHAAVVERLHVFPEECLRDVVVQRRALEMGVGEQKPDNPGDFATVLLGQLDRLTKRAGQEGDGCDK